MKYFAILRDSFREALASKVLYFMLGLSVLVILLVSSVSFRPVGLEEQVQGIADQFNFAYSFQGHAINGKLNCGVRDFKKLNDAPEPWRGDYQFTFFVTFDDRMAPQAEQLGGAMDQLFREGFWWLDNLKVQKKEVPGPPAREIRVEVSSHGTRIKDAGSWPHEPALFFGAWRLSWLRTSLTYAVYWIQNRLVNWVGGSVAVLIGIIVTASFIPGMLRKGAVDLLLAKPVRRTSLLVFKYLGGLTFMFVNAAFVITGIWLVLGMRSGLWAPGFLVSTLVLTYFFAILYAVSTLFGVLTRSTVVCILMTCFAWLLLWIVGLLYDWVQPPRTGDPSGVASRDVTVPRKTTGGMTGEIFPGWVSTVVTTAHTVLPRTGDLTDLTTRLVSHSLLSKEERKHRNLEIQRPITWGESLGVSTAFIVVMLALACWFFATRDY
jgi:ABC-type transport system involved in multi-copper enzyme maturation permease subunit